MNGGSEGLLKSGICLPSGPDVAEEDVRYIVNEMKESILGNYIVSIFYELMSENSFSGAVFFVYMHI